jgi:hypothetical protein
MNPEKAYVTSKLPSITRLRKTLERWERRVLNARVLCKHHIRTSGGTGVDCFGNTDRKMDNVDESSLIEKRPKVATIERGVQEDRRL